MMLDIFENQDSLFKIFGKCDLKIAAQFNQRQSRLSTEKDTDHLLELEQQDTVCVSVCHHQCPTPSALN